MGAAVPSTAGAALCGLTLLVVGCASEVHREELPIEDDFSGDCNWSQEKNENVSLGCEDGQYRVLFTSTEQTERNFIEQYLEEPVDSGAVEADVTLRALPAGADPYSFSGIGCLTVSPNDPLRGYLFFVGAIGARGEDRGFAIVEVDETDESLSEDGYFRYLADELSDAVGGVGETNHIRGECRAKEQRVELAMFLDGNELKTVSDPNRPRPFEAFALIAFASEAGTDVRYDNFVAEEIGQDDSN